MQEEIKKIPLDDATLVIKHLGSLCESNYPTSAFKTFASPQEFELRKLLKEVDYGYHTHAEYEAGKAANTNYCFIEAEHNPSRMAVCCLASFEEKLLNEAIITISKDDPKESATFHTNTYKLILHDPEQTNYISTKNPAITDPVQDFDTIFIKQMTHYPGKEPENTTDHAYDSFLRTGDKHKNYEQPKRRLDAKSHLWTSGKNHHNVHYILKIKLDTTNLFSPKYSVVVGKIQPSSDGLSNIFTEIDAKIVLNPANVAKYLPQYIQLANIIANPRFKALKYSDLI